MKHKIKHIGAVLAFALLLTACGGDAEDTAPADENGAGEAGPDADEQPAGTAPDDSGGIGGADKAGGPSGTSSGAGFAPAASEAQKQAVVLAVSDARAEQMAEAIYAAAADQLAGTPSVDAETLGNRLGEWRCDHVWAADSIDRHLSVAQADALAAIPDDADVYDRLAVLRDGPWAESSTQAAENDLLEVHAECLDEIYSDGSSIGPLEGNAFGYPIQTQTASPGSAQDIEHVTAQFSVEAETLAAAFRSPALTDAIIDAALKDAGLPEDQLAEGKAAAEFADFGGFLALVPDVVDCANGVIADFLEGHLSDVQADRLRRLPDGLPGIDKAGLIEIMATGGNPVLDKFSAMWWLIEIGPWHDLSPLYPNDDRDSVLDITVCWLLLADHP